MLEKSRWNSVLGTTNTTVVQRFSLVLAAAGVVIALGFAPAGADGPAGGCQDFSIPVAIAPDAPSDSDDVVGCGPSIAVIDQRGRSLGNHGSQRVVAHQYPGIGGI